MRLRRFLMVTGVHEPVHGHLGHAHELGDFGHRQESDVWNLGHPTYPFLDEHTLWGRWDACKPAWLL